MIISLVRSAQIRDQLEVQGVAAFVAFDKLWLVGRVHQLNCLLIGHAGRMLGVENDEPAVQLCQLVQKLDPGIPDIFTINVINFFHVLITFLVL